MLTTSQSLSLKLDVQSTACLLSRWVRKKLEKKNKETKVPPKTLYWIIPLDFIAIRNVIQNAALVKHVQKQRIQWTKQRDQQSKSLGFWNWNLVALCINIWPHPCCDRLCIYGMRWKVAIHFHANASHINVRMVLFDFPSFLIITAEWTRRTESLLTEATQRVWALGESLTEIVSCLVVLHRSSESQHLPSGSLSRAC